MSQSVSVTGLFCISLATANRPMLIPDFVLLISWPWKVQRMYSLKLVLLRTIP